MKRLLLLVIPLCLAGCVKVGPDFTPPCAPEQEEWIQEDATDGTHSANAQWWNCFEDPQLNCLIEVASNQNLTLKAAGMRILEAKAQLGFVVGEFFPQLQEATGNVTRQGISRNAPNSAFIDRHFYDEFLGFQVAWELDFWGKFRRGIESAQGSLLATYASFDDIYVILIADVASTYIAIRTIEERINIVEKNIALQARSLEIVTARFNAGAVTELDLSQAKTLLFSTESRLYELEALLRDAQNALTTLLGVTPAQLTCYLDKGNKIPSPNTHVISAGVPAELLYRRPDVRQSLYEAAAQSAKIGIAYADFFPQISISGLIGLQNAAGATSSRVAGNQKFFSADSFTFSVGPGFRWPILNYGRITNRVRFEQARFLELVADYQNSVLLAYQEVESGLSAFVNAQYEVEKLIESAKAALRATQLARTQYVEGIADYTRVLNTEESLLNEEERLVEGKGKIALSLVATYRSLGGGWRCH